MASHLTQAIPVAVEKFADCGPGNWWFVHHPDGFLIECAIQRRAEQIAAEINAGRSILFPSVGSTGANMEQCDVESSALRASSAVKVGAPNSPDGADEVPAQDSGGNETSGESARFGKSNAARPASVDAHVNDGRLAGEVSAEVVTVVGNESGTLANSNQQGINGPLLPVEAATEKQAACASRPIDSNSQVFSEPANAGEIDPSQASPAPHSTGATVDKIGRAGEHPSAPVTLSTKKQWVPPQPQPNPKCQNPGKCKWDHGVVSCWRCNGAPAEGEAVA